MSTTFKKNISEPWFSLMKLGMKTCEGRLQKGDFINIKENDILVIENHELGFPRSFCAIVQSIQTYSTFTQFLEKESLVDCLPGIETIQEGEQVYYQYYSKQEEKKYGVLSLRMKVL